MSHSENIVIEITAVRNPADLSKQVILPEDTATVEQAVRSQNPDMSDRRVNDVVDSLTTGSLAMARVTGSVGAKTIRDGVQVNVSCAAKIVPTLPDGTVVSYRGEAPSTVIDRHPETFEYTVRTASGYPLRRGAEWFLEVELAS